MPLTGTVVPEQSSGVFVHVFIAQVQNMTIRYKCEECASVLKIRDELAGTSAKCPKCKLSFTVPAAAGRKAGVRKPSSEQSPAAADEEDPVDMPREITPVPDLSGEEEFDPMSALDGPGGTAAVAAAAPEAPKPSIAELMREHEATRKKKGADKKGKGGLAEAAAIADVLTSGSAADALTRTYDQKRGKAGEPPPATREERREVERREAMKDFAKKGGAALAGLFVVLFFLIRWMLAEPLPDLEYISGVVSQKGVPLADVEVMFAPVLDLDTAEVKRQSGLANSSSGITNAQGEFILMYDVARGIEGAVPGLHNVTIMSSGGVEIFTGQMNVPSADKTYNFFL